MTQKIISCDLGGTKCAAGLVEYDVLGKKLHCSKKISVKIADAKSLKELLQQIEGLLDYSLHNADAICIGAAGQYNGEKVILEGAYPYEMNFAELARQQKWPAFAIVHDYTPIVCATFTEYMHDQKNLKMLNTAPFNPFGRRVALGLGTGLGMKDGVLFSDGQFWLGKNEIGHIGISTPPATNKTFFDMHCELIRTLKTDEPITFEKILSGPGTVRLHQFFYPEREKLSPREIWMLANDPKTAGELTEMLDAFAWYLGLFIGTVQLIFMPEGGIWITGGVTLHYLDLFDRPAFNEGIKTSPAYLNQRSNYPLGILKNQEHAIIGGGYYAAKRLL